MIKKIHARSKMNFSCNISEVIRKVYYSLLIFFTKRFPTHQKAPKNTKKHKTQPKKTKNANKRTKFKNGLKKHLKGKK